MLGQQVIPQSFVEDLQHSVQHFGSRQYPRTIRAEWKPSSRSSRTVNRRPVDVIRVVLDEPAELLETVRARGRSASTWRSRRRRSCVHVALAKVLPGRLTGLQHADDQLIEFLGVHRPELQQLLQRRAVACRDFRTQSKLRGERRHSRCAGSASRHRRRPNNSTGRRQARHHPSGKVFVTAARDRRPAKLALDPDRPPPSHPWPRRCAGRPHPPPP